MFTKDNINDFVNLSDDEIKRRISTAAAAGNISQDKLKSALADTDKIRQVIAKMRPEDFERILKIIGKDNAEAMAQKLKENL